MLRYLTIGLAAMVLAFSVACSSSNVTGTMLPSRNAASVEQPSGGNDVMSVEQPSGGNDVMKCASSVEQPSGGNDVMSVEQPSGGNDVMKH